MKNVIDYAIEQVVYTTPYSANQCYRVIEIITKYGELAPYHMTKKQNKILNEILKELGQKKD